jgi:hypothetical protein
MEIKMSIDINTKKIERQAQRVYYQDGLLELILGVYLIFVGGLLYIDSKLVPFTIFIIFGIKPLWERLKEHITYPRIGYVVFPDDEEAGKGILKTLVMFFILGAALAAGIVSLLGNEQGWDLFWFRIVPALVGVLLACGPIYAAGKFGLRRWYAIAALFVLSGLVAPFASNSSVYATIGLQMSLIGVILSLVGLLLLIKFIRRHPLLDEEGVNATE